jgi:hypothetical protein
MISPTNPPIPTTKIEPHPYAAIFPPLGIPAYQRLVSGIHLHGLHNPIVLIYDPDDDGEMVVRILDGCNRYRACHETRHAEEHLRYVWFHDVVAPGVDPLDWVSAQNLNRRHLTSGQRKDAAEKLTRVLEGRARLARQAAAARTNAQRWGTETEEPSDVQQALLGTPPPTGRSRDIAAREFDVSPSAVQTTRRIRRDGAEGLADLHRDEMVTTATADGISRLPTAAQLGIVETVQQVEEKSEAQALALKLLRAAQRPITTLPAPPPRTEAPPPQTAAPDAPTAVLVPPAAGSPPLWGLPDRGEILVSRNLLDVLIAVAEGQHDHPHREQALAALRIQLQHDDWGMAG